MIYYKIRNKENPELFVKGTPHYLSYDKTGRIFQSIGNLRSFLTGVMKRQYGRQVIFSAEWEIVELEMVVREVKEVIDVIDSKKILDILSK